MHDYGMTPFDMSHTLTKQSAYRELLVQLNALLAGERDWIVNSAQFAAFIAQQVPGLNWVGFYWLRQGELVLGSFQGKVACTRISLDKGVCGACARTRQIQCIADVHAFPGHIACDGASNAELVLPVLQGEHLLGVFDLDSPQPGRFDEYDSAGMQALVAAFVDATDMPAW